jgi:hypothetical protein
MSMKSRGLAAALLAGAAAAAGIGYPSTGRAAGVGQSGAMIGPAASATPSPGSTNAVPTAGSRAPGFTLPDLDGKRVALSHFSGHPVVVFFFCGCSACADVARAWGQAQNGGQFPVLHDGKRPDRPVPTVIVYSGGADGARRLLHTSGLDVDNTTALVDADMDITLNRYRVEPCPRVFVLDGAGRVTYTNDHAYDAPQIAPGVAIAGQAVRAAAQATVMTGRVAPTAPAPSTGSRQATATGQGRT